MCVHVEKQVVAENVGEEDEVEDEVTDAILPELIHPGKERYQFVSLTQFLVSETLRHQSSLNESRQHQSSS